MTQYNMKRLLTFWISVVFTQAVVGCKAHTASSYIQAPEPRPAATPVPANREYPEHLSNVFVGEDSLSYNTFEVIKLTKKVTLEYPPEMKLTPEVVEVSYAVLKKKGKVLAKFDGVYFGAGNATDFGLFSFLGGGTKQLAVSQTIPRGGRHWVADLASDGRIIFDSADYGVGREEFSVIDLDKDGIYEISLPITEFYMFENMAMSETPLPEIVFKYEKKARKYLPANLEFQAYSLRNIEEDLKRLDSNDGREYLSKRLDIVLRYVYAGKEDQAWSFFEKEYQRPDKEEMKSKIMAVLRDEGVYKHIYRPPVP